MTTAGSRLAYLSGGTGPAGALLLSIGTGFTAGAALANYSGRIGAPAAVHLVENASSPTEPAAAVVGGFSMRVPKRGEYPKRRRRLSDEEFICALLC